MQSCEREPSSFIRPHGHLERFKALLEHCGTEEGGSGLTTASEHAHFRQGGAGVASVQFNEPVSHSV